MSKIIQYFPFNSEFIPSDPSVICLGNFDGVHIAHKALVDEAINIKEEMYRSGQKVRVGALCFDSLTADHFGGKVPHLMSLTQKLNAFRDMGLDFVYVCSFAEVKNMSPDDFIEKVLWAECFCVSAVCGYNFKFGKGAIGNGAHLKKRFYERYRDKHCFRMVDNIMYEGRPVSSSAIRECLKDGDLTTANAMLGRPFSICHTVVRGKHLGTSLGFPTLNHVFREKEIVPAYGIYATKTKVNGKVYLSATNIGVRPTVSVSDTVTCETYIIDIDIRDSDLYGNDVEILFYSKLRGEMRFESFDQLSVAISNDVKNVKAYFAVNE